MKALWDKYWQVVAFILMIVFTVGYTVAQFDGTKDALENKADKVELLPKVDRIEVVEIVKEAITQLRNETKEGYIKIEQVPGLQERLKNIEDKANENSAMLRKIYELNLKGK